MKLVSVPDPFQHVHKKWEEYVEKGLGTRLSLARTIAGMQAWVLECN